MAHFILKFALLTLVSLFRVAIEMRSPVYQIPVFP